MSDEKREGWDAVLEKFIEQRGGLTKVISKTFLDKMTSSAADPDAVDREAPFDPREEAGEHDPKQKG